MPFTPFHFGLGLLVKAALPKHFYFWFFVALQVLTDLETLTNLLLKRYPVHRFLHTFVGAGVLATVSSLVVLAALRVFRRGDSSPLNRSSCASLFLTAFIATWSHVVLDAMMHADARPFFPFSSNNPFLGLVSVGTLHDSLIFFGVVGVFVWLLRVAFAHGKLEQ